MTHHLNRRGLLALGAAGGTCLAGLAPAWAKADDLLNASFSTTTQLYTGYNALFATNWQKTSGGKPGLRVSYGAGLRA